METKFNKISNLNTKYADNVHISDEQSSVHFLRFTFSLRFRFPASCHVLTLSSKLLSSRPRTQSSNSSNYKVESCGSDSDCALIAVFDLAVSAQDLAHVAI